MRDRVILSLDAFPLAATLIRGGMNGISTTDTIQVWHKRIRYDQATALIALRQLTMALSCGTSC